MNPMKRLGLVAVLVVGVTLLASTPALARVSWRDWGTIQFTSTGAEPEASGQASLTNVVCRDSNPYDPDPWRTEYCSGKLTVYCQDLTPGATYWTPAGTFIANRKGEGKISGQVDFTVEWYNSDWWGPVVSDPYEVDVVRLDPDGSILVKTLVLTGEFSPPWCLDY